MENEIAKSAEDSSTTDKEDVAIEDVQKKLSKIILGLYAEATLFLHQLQTMPKSPSLKKRLENVNKKIKEKNQEEG